MTQSRASRALHVRRCIAFTKQRPKIMTSTMPVAVKRATTIHQLKFSGGTVV